MFDPASGRYKIGMAADVAARIKDHRTACPDIRLVAAVQTPSAEALETRVLNHFASARIGLSEWLAPTAEVVAWVERFVSRPNTANRAEDIASKSWTTPDLWPWSEGDPLPEHLDGQTAIPMDLGPYIADVEDGVTGQTSAISEDWYTPPLYVAAVRELFGGTIDLDPASCPEANMTVAASNIYTAEVDGLRMPWAGNVYLNPPWGRKGSAKRAFVTKAIGCYTSGAITAAVLALNSNAATSAWFEDLFAYPICFPNHRVKHYGPGGAGGAPNSGTVFVYLGRDIEGFIRIFSRFGPVVVRAPGQAQRLPLAEDYDEASAA